MTPLPRYSNCFPRFVIGNPLVMRRATPCSKVIVPSVSINGSARVLAASEPFKKPIKQPSASPAVIEIQTGMPDLSILDTTQAVTDIAEPTERSIPPDIIRTVMPIETMPRVETCCKMFLMFLADRNTGEEMPMIIMSAIKTKITPHCWKLTSFLMRIRTLSCGI